MTISKDKVKPSPSPDSWKLAEIFATGVVLGAYMAVTTVLFFWAAYKTEFFVVHIPSLVHWHLCCGVHTHFVFSMLLLAGHLQGSYSEYK
jgi:hypothetical protein